MKDNYFDEKLKGILESAPELQPEASAVKDMQQRLRGINPPEKRKRNPWLFFIPLLLLPLLFGAGFFYQKYDALNMQVIELSRQVSDIKQTHYRDTIFQKQTIHQFDTIYTVIYKEKYIKEYQTNKNSNYLLGYYASPIYTKQLASESFSTANILNRLNWSLGNSKNSLLANNPNSSLFEKEDDFAERKSTLLTPKSTLIQSLESRGLEMFPIKKMEKLSWVQKTVKDISPNKAWKKHSMRHFIPQGMALELDAAPVLPIDAFNSFGFATGINGNVNFSQGRSLQIGAKWLNIRFELKRDKTDQFSLFPIVSPTDPVDVLSELKANLNYLQIPISVAQHFLLDRKWQPFVRLGFVASRPFNQVFTYEYVSDIELYTLTQNFNNGQFSIDNLNLGLGANYSFGKLSTLMGIDYQHGFSQGPNEYFKLRYFSLNVGLRYKLY